MKHIPNRSLYERWNESGDIIATIELTSNNTKIVWRHKYNTIYGDLNTNKYWTIEHIQNAIKSKWFKENLITRWQKFKSK